jgi:hypothetical protein
MAKNSGLGVIVLGVLLFLGAGFADLYPVKSISAIGQSLINSLQGYATPQQIAQMKIEYTVTTYPYQQWVYPLIFAGVALFVLGFALMVYQRQNSPPPPTQNQ